MKTGFPSTGFQFCDCWRCCLSRYPGISLGLPRWLSGKESACQRRVYRRRCFHPWVGKIPWRRKWQPTPVLLPEKSLRQWSLVGHGVTIVQHDLMTEHAHVQACMQVFFSPWPGVCTLQQDLPFRFELLPPLPSALKDWMLHSPSLPLAKIRKLG